MQEGIDTFLERPLTGVGAGQFKNYNPPGRQERWRETHNVLIQVASETGIFGLLVFCFLIVRGGLGAASTRRMLARSKEDRGADPLRLVMGEADFPSRQENGEGYLLTSGMMQWFIGHYLTGCEDMAGEPYCSPLVAELSDLPPAIIVVAEYDPLRDEGIEYARRLKEDGVFVDLRREAGMIHGFFWMGGAVDRGREVIDELGTEIGKILRDQ